MKLVSVNMEGEKHLDRIYQLIITESPDCICLQEAPETYTQTLATLGYTSAFAEMGVATQHESTFTIGIIIASKKPFIHRTHYYASVGTVEEPVIIGTRKIAMRYPYLFAELTDPSGKTFHIATIHMMVTADGASDTYQTLAMQQMLTQLAQEPSHIICGDFNMPRGYNNLYEVITATYKDVIPPEYQSSLDRNLHRYGQKSDLNAPIFDTYMVDYIFSQPPYAVENVQLKFGVSDHAAILANINLE